MSEADIPNLERRQTNLAAPTAEPFPDPRLDAVLTHLNTLDNVIQTQLIDNLNNLPQQISELKEAVEILNQCFHSKQFAQISQLNEHLHQQSRISSEVFGKVAQELRTTLQETCTLVEEVSICAAGEFKEVSENLDVKNVKSFCQHATSRLEKVVSEAEKRIEQQAARFFWKHFAYNLVFSLSLVTAIGAAIHYFW